MRVCELEHAVCDVFMTHVHIPVMTRCVVGTAWDPARRGARFLTRRQFQ